MASHHPRVTTHRPTTRQQRYLRALAQQTGTSFTQPATNADASREITRLEGLQRSPRADRIRDERAVQADLQAGAGDSVRHRRGETRGDGSSARWAHNREADR